MSSGQALIENKVYTNSLVNVKLRHPLVACDMLEEAWFRSSLAASLPLFDQLTLVVLHSRLGLRGSIHVGSLDCIRQLCP